MRAALAALVAVAAVAADGAGDVDAAPAVDGDDGVPALELLEYLGGLEQQGGDWIGPEDVVLPAGESAAALDDGGGALPADEESGDADAG